MIISSIFTFLTTTIGLSTALGAAGAVIGGVLIYGGSALSLLCSNRNKNTKGVAVSPSYAETLTTQTSQNLPIPLLYGTVKLAGNRIWQLNDTSFAEVYKMSALLDDKCQCVIKRIVAFSAGEICGYSDIRLNNIPVSSLRQTTVRQYYGTFSQQVDPIVTGKTNSKRIETVGSLKGIAYLAVTTPEYNKITREYNLTAVVKGRKIRVYLSRYVYVVQYSENPVWVTFDFLCNYNALGLALDENGNIDDNLVEKYFDLDSFIESAAYCDQLVDGSPRFTFNMIFDSQTSARDLLDEIYRSCRGGLFFKNGKLQFKVDKAEPVSRVFSQHDIVSGSETFKPLPIEDKYDILKCVYISPEHEWQKVEAFAEIPVNHDGVPTEHSVNMFSVTNFKQASRLAWYYLNSRLLCPYFGSFQTDYRASDLEVGDVISINSLLMGLNNYKVKVTSVVDNGSGFYTVNWRTYDARLYSDTLGSLKPRAIVTTLDNKYEFPDTVMNFNVVQKDDMFEFVWDYNKESDISYEIRCGKSWLDAKIIATGIKNNSYSCKIKNTGEYTFLIKAFNGYSFSENAARDMIYVTDIPDMNKVLSFDILKESLKESALYDEIFENTKIYNGKLKLVPDTENLNNWHLENTFWSGEDSYYSKNGYWGTDIIQSGAFTSKVFDIEKNLTCNLSLKYNFLSPSNADNFVNVYYRYSQDNVNWSDWICDNSGEITFEFIQFRMVLNSSANCNLAVTSFSAEVDVPDKFRIVNAEVVNANTGININYEDFAGIPAVVATVNDDISAYAVATKHDRYVKIKIYDNNGTPKTGRVSVFIKGY